MDKTIISKSNVYGTKSITLDQYPDEAWDFLSGERDGEIADVQTMYKAVPWLYQGVNIIAKSAAEVPIALYRGDTVITSSEDWQDPTGYLPDMAKLLRKISASIVLEGQGYLFRDDAKTIRATKRLIFWNPTTVKVDSELTKQTRQLYFKRTVNGKVETYTDEQVIYFWPDDGYTEVGPPQSSPAKAALAAAGVLYNADRYVTAYWQRGAVKATMLAIKGGASDAEKTKLATWWKSITSGISKAFSVFSLNADTVTPVTVGDGLAGLQNTELTNEKREDISTALGVPQSILFSTAAGGLDGAGVVDSDHVNLFELTVIPLVRLIVGVLNEQQLKDTGYRLAVNENEMAIYQEDEASRATALKAMIDALANPEEFLIASDIIGFELDDEARAKVETLVAGKNERAARVQEQMKPDAEPEAQPEQAAPVEEPQEEAEPKYIDDLNRWRRKALKAGGMCAFVSDTIPPHIRDTIGTRLECATTPDEIKAAFVLDTEPQVDDRASAIIALANSIKQAISVIGA